MHASYSMKRIDREGGNGEYDYDSMVNILLTEVTM